MTQEVQHALPSALNTDAQWAMAIAWMQAHGLNLRVPLRGEISFEQKRDEAPKQTVNRD